MHFSMLSNSFFSDSINDAAPSARKPSNSVGIAHRDGVARGINFFLILGLLSGVLSASGSRGTSTSARAVVDLSQMAFTPTERMARLLDPNVLTHGRLRQAHRRV